MSDIAKELFNSIITNNATPEAFNNAVASKLDQALEIRKVNLSSQIYNNNESFEKEVVEESADLKEAKLEQPKSKNDLVNLLKKAKAIRGVSDDEYMQWYGEMDEKLFSDWDKMVKKDPNYKNAYKLGYDGGSDKNPHKSETLAFAIWADQYAAGAMDS